jgi:hypothetical protein
MSQLSLSHLSHLSHFYILAEKAKEEHREQGVHQKA